MRISRVSVATRSSVACWKKDQETLSDKGGREANRIVRVSVLIPQGSQRTMPNGSSSNHRRSHSTLADRARALGVILREEFGIPFVCYDVSTGALVGVTGTAEVAPGAELTPEAVDRLATEERSR